MRTKEERDQLILDHYRKVAKNFGLSSSCTLQDSFIRSKELEFITSSIQNFLLSSKLRASDIKILDAGCGNGYLLNHLRLKFPEVNLFGLEFTPELYNLTKEREISNCSIVQSDLRNEINIAGKFDIVITERVVINILDYAEQRKVFKNIVGALRTGGLYIQVESFFEPLVNLNRARKEMGLGVIQQSVQNKYLNNYMLGFLRDKCGLIEQKGAMPENYLSTYFFLSRVFHQVTRPEGAKVKYSHMVDFLTEGIGPGVGNYSPILFKCFLLQ